LKLFGGQLTAASSNIGGMRFTIYIPKHPN